MYTRNQLKSEFSQGNVNSLDGSQQHSLSKYNQMSVKEPWASTECFSMYLFAVLTTGHSSQLILIPVVL